MIAARISSSQGGDDMSIINVKLIPNFLPLELKNRNFVSVSEEE